MELIQSSVAVAICIILHHICHYPSPRSQLDAACLILCRCFSPASRHAPRLGHQENKWKKQFEIAKKQAFSEGVLWRPMGMPKVLGRAPTERTSKACMYIYIYIYMINVNVHAVEFLPEKHRLTLLMDKSTCSPPARWGLLDFMSAAFRFRSSCLPLLPSAPAFRSCLPPRLPPPRPLLVLLVQLRSAIHIVRCRTSTTTIHAQRSLPDLNHDHPRPVFPAGPQPRPSAPSVPCRTSTTTIPAQCSLPDLNREYPSQVFPAGPHVGRYST